MVMRKPMTASERKLFKEAIIREYKLRNEAHTKDNLFNIFLKRLKKITPFSVLLGIAACAVLVAIEGWENLLHILLLGVIWITLISTVLTALIKAR